MQLARSNAEVVKARELADIAAGQVTALTAAYSARQEDVESLREQARERAAASDDDAIIGKLQRQLMEQKAAYHNLTKKSEATRLALQRSNVALAATEAAIDEKTAEVWRVAVTAACGRFASPVCLCVNESCSKHFINGSYPIRDSSCRAGAGGKG